MATLGQRLIKLSVLYSLLKNPSTASSAHTLVQHDLPSVQQYCQDLSSLVIDRLSNESVTSDERFANIAIPIVKEFPRVPIYNGESHCRFLTDLNTSAGKFESRYGSCSVPYLKGYLTCSFTLQDNGSTLQFNFIMEAAARTMCMEDTYPRIKAWDASKGTECILNFGSSCCLYDPKNTEEPSPKINKLPIIVSYVSAALLAVAAVVYLLLMAMERLNTKKEAGNQTITLQGREES